ncbi:MAG: hypothetical protein QOG87_1507 [Actinomycetota bacterium]|jgi:hypothetical protein
MLSPLDDYPIHQTSEVMRHVATSDRNFYDRYYFNLGPCGDDLFLLAGLGQYPNLGVADGFVAVMRNGKHHVVRASRELGVDRMDTTVGPIAVEVLEGLKRLRVTCEGGEGPIELDAVFEGSHPAHEEPRHYQRRNERVFFDTMRLAQTGRWSGRLRVGDEEFDITPDRWWGTRDRSWGIRPVGEPEPPGIAAAGEPQGFFWIYAPFQFDDHSIITITQENTDGSRVLEEAVRVWHDGRPTEHLGRPEYDLEFEPGTRFVRRATLHFTEPGGRALDVHVTPTVPLWLMLGTGYGGMEPDWRHGMYQGPLKVETRSYDIEAEKPDSRFNLIDNLAKFDANGQTGWGLFEQGTLGPHTPSGFTSWEDVAP